MQMEREKHVWIGVDISKETFCAAVDILDGDGSKKEVNSLQTKEFELTETGSDSFLNWLSESFPEYHFSMVMESTGCYSKKLSKFLHARQNDLPISILNGRQSSNFVKSLGLPHKTDKSDAQALARFGTERSPKPALPDDPVRESLKELSRERSALLKAKAALENRSDSLFAAFTKDINNRAIVALNLQISAIEKEMERCIKANAELRHEAELMKTVPGVGPTSAYGFLAELGSLKQYSSRKLSSMSGLLPHVFISGTSVNKTCLSKRGSARVRQLLYLDCMTAVNKIPQLNSQYLNLVSRGKTKMTARCACMRKLLLIIRAVVVEDRPYEKISKKGTKTA
jgi:transposase